MPTELYSLSPIDGRYAKKSAPLRTYLSEQALIKYRLSVEIAWLIAQSECPDITHVRPFTAAERQLLAELVSGFDDEAAERVKAIEARARHDVKAVEYFLRERINGGSLSQVSEAIHFACTSDDINNLAYALMIRDALREVWQPKAGKLLSQLTGLARDTAAMPMLARTHGQAASPTTLGKEMAVFAHRLRRQLRIIESQEYLGKFNGAVGAYNAHHIAYPDLDWLSLSRRFVESLGLAFNPLSTQIEPHDALAELAQALTRFNTILLDLCRDCWTYISLGYFRQRTRSGEVGSSTMPHKVNPIDFENAEANLGISSSCFAHLAAKLPVSRLQRDLSDSSALRNYGVAIAHSYLALDAIQRGLSKLEVDSELLANDLEDHWEVLAEAVQTVMRKHQIAGAFEELKEFTRGARISREALHEFIRQLAIPEEDKQRLLALKPATYIGLAHELALSVLEDE